MVMFWPLAYPRPTSPLRISIPILTNRDSLRLGMFTSMIITPIPVTETTPIRDGNGSIENIAVYGEMQLTTSPLHLLTHLCLRITHSQRNYLSNELEIRIFPMTLNEGVWDKVGSNYYFAKTTTSKQWIHLCLPCLSQHFPDKPT